MITLADLWRWTRSGRYTQANLLGAAAGVRIGGTAGWWDGGSADGERWTVSSSSELETATLGVGLNVGWVLKEQMWGSQIPALSKWVQGRRKSRQGCRGLGRKEDYTFYFGHTRFEIPV